MKWTALAAKEAPTPEQYRRWVALFLIVFVAFLPPRSLRVYCENGKARHFLASAELTSPLSVDRSFALCRIDLNYRELRGGEAHLLFANEKTISFLWKDTEAEWNSDYTVSIWIYIRLFLGSSVCQEENNVHNEFYALNSLGLQRQNISYWQNNTCYFQNWSIKNNMTFWSDDEICWTSNYNFNGTVPRRWW